MKQETGDFLVWGAPKLKIHEIISWDIRFSRWGDPKTESTWEFLLRYKICSWDKRQEIFSLGRGQNWKDMRFSLETWDFLMRQETGDFFIWGGLKLIRHEIFSWDMRFSHKTGDRRFSCWGGQTDTTWDFFLRHDIFSWDRRQEIFLLGGGQKW